MKKGFKVFTTIALVCMLALSVGCLVACHDEPQPEKVTVTLAEKEITMSEWSSKDIVARASDASAVTLSVSDTTVLYLSGTVITALKPGTATVTATLKSDETVKETATVTVTADAASKPAVRITGENIVAVGDTAMYSATLLRAPAGEYGIEYEVSDTTVADIDGDGILTAKTIGTVRITATATYRTVKFEEEFEVEVKPLSVAFKDKSIAMDEWESKRIEVDTFGSAATLSVSDTTVLYLSGNTVTAIGAGTATITATLDKDPAKTATLRVNVTANEANRPKLTIDGDQFVAVGDKLTYAATLSNAAPGEYNVVFTADDGGAVADVTTAGAFNAKAAGDITLTATTTYRSVRFTATKSVKTVNVTDVTFLKGEDNKTLNVNSAFNLSPTVGEGKTVKIGEENYTTASGGTITLARTDYANANGKIKEVTVDSVATKYYVRTFVSTTAGTAYSNKAGFAADSDGKYTVNADTAFTDENGLTWITFDSYKEKLNNKYKYLRVTVKFNAFADDTLLATDIVSANMHGDEPYKYSFGYKYGNTFVYFDRTYSAGMFGGTINQSTGWAYDSGKPVLRIYSDDGDRLMTWDDTQWSPYLTALETGKEYIFEFPVESTGDITANFGFDAEVTEIEWSIWDLYAETAAGAPDTAVGKIYAGETELTADEGTYTLDGTSVPVDANDVSWVNFGNDAFNLRAYKYLRVTVTFSEFAGKGEGEGGIPKYNDGYGFDFGFTYQNKFVSYDVTQKYGFHGLLVDSGSTAAGSGVGKSAFVIYDSEGNVLVEFNGDTYDPWTSKAVEISTNTEYVFEFPIYETGAITANFGKSATVKDVTWAKTSLAEELADAALGSPATCEGNVFAGGTALGKTGEVYEINGTTVTPDAHGISWVTFDDAAAKQALGYKYLRVTVTFSEFAGKGAGEGGIPKYNDGYGFDFGFKYKYKDKDQLFVSYTATEGYGFHGYLESGAGAGYIGFVIYATDGSKVAYWNGDVPGDPWSGAKMQISANTEYIFEFPIHETGDITANFGASATIKEITWAKTSLGAAA